MKRKDIVGYSNQLSVRAGDSLQIKVSTYGPESYSAQLVRIVCGDDTPGGAVFCEKEIENPADGDHPGRHQPIRPGSCVLIAASEDFSSLTSFVAAANIWPTQPGTGRQTILGTWCGKDRCGFEIFLDDEGALGFRLGDGRADQTFSNGEPLALRRWTRVAVSLDAKVGALRLTETPLPLIGDLERPRPATQCTGETSLAPTTARARPLTIGARLVEVGGERTLFDSHFDGKIESPRLAAQALSPRQIEDLVAAQSIDDLGEHVVGAWDFSIGIQGESVHDLSGRENDGETRQLPTRAMTGSNWDGTEHDWRHAPEQYGAIHFHSDDLYDAEWTTDFDLLLPSDLQSGLYAVRLTTGTGGEDHVPFFVRPKSGTSSAEIVFLAPTATYTAYANSRLHFQAPGIEIMQGRLSLVTSNTMFLLEHPECGLSLYDHHADGSGVCISSRLRPILDMRPKTRLWSLNSDTHILSWLEKSEFDFDVLTDEDLDREGEAALRPYRVVLTGSHPEYVSKGMLDALHTHLQRGGRLMYLGGNGFYWNTVYHPDKPGVIEVRRTEDGTRAWKTQPGESHHAFNGEYGGLWQRKGRPPNRLVGVGFTAQGFDVSSHYRRRDASNDPRAAFVFAGIDEDLIGDFGVVGGGAAGEEIDRFDKRLGSPSHALVLATSENHSATYMVTKEELFSNIPGTSGLESPMVRADMVFFETPGGGAVFSTGSIAWAASLPVDDYDNNVARLTRNVLRRFVDSEPFQLPG